VLLVKVQSIKLIEMIAEAFAAPVEQAFAVQPTNAELVAKLKPVEQVSARQSVRIVVA
jgi:hypothetical protein